ncbi:dTDP-4-amino-4,6-dideoxygalactose transaminase [Luteimonas sp. A277]
MTIPFNRPYVGASVLDHIQTALKSGHLSGDGNYTKRCHAWLEEATGTKKALLTHSCTAALEMAALLADLQPGDEVIMPSYTFVSTANAFVLRGAIPVFVDIRRDTLNIDERLLEEAITPRTRAICVVHYAGVGCEMDTILEIAAQYDLMVIEDAAQAIGATYKGRTLGTFGALAALSFHETKNIISGEGGALLINDIRYAERAEVIREKGTNRSKFFRGQVDKYTWIDVGSSFLPGELVAALLYSQLMEAPMIQKRRMQIWEKYHEWAEPHEIAGKLRRPIIPENCVHNAHMYYLLLPDLKTRSRFIDLMNEQDIATVFHYIPLHTAPAGRRFGRAHGDMPNTDRVSETLVRLPLWSGLEEQEVEHVIESAERALARISTGQ